MAYCHARLFFRLNIQCYGVACFVARLPLQAGVFHRSAISPERRHAIGGEHFEHSDANVLHVSVWSVIG